MADDRELDADTRRGLRILADSTKAKGSEGAARRLYKAADSGRHSDYQQAEEVFDSLPPEKRSSIQASAETKAETVRATKARRKAPPSPTDPAPAEFLAWELPDPDSTEGIFRKIEPGIPAAPPQDPRPTPGPSVSKPTAPPAAEEGKSWDFNNIPGNPRAKRPRKPAPEPAQPQPDASVDDDGDGQSWDWQRLPDDPVLRSRPGKSKPPKNELEALRQEMLRTLKD